LEKHNWTETDDLAALYVYRFGHHRIAGSLSGLAESLDIGAGSFRMRIQNFKAIHTDGGLSNNAQQSARVYQRYRETTEPQLRTILLSAFESAGVRLR